MIAVVAALLLAAKVPKPQKPEELAVNGGFEQVKLRLQSSSRYVRDMLDKGWDFGKRPLAEFPLKWYPQPNSAPAKFLVVKGKSGKEVHSGERCVYVKRLGKKGETRLSGPVRGKARRTYRCSLWARGSGRLVTRCYGQDSLGRSVPCSPKPGRIDVKLGKSWKKYCVDVRATGAKVSQFNIALAVCGEAWLDDVSLIEIRRAGKKAKPSSRTKDDL